MLKKHIKLLEQLTGKKVTLKEQHVKRYVVLFDMYVYASDDQQAKEEANKIMLELNDQYDAQAAVKEVHEMSFGSITPRKVSFESKKNIDKRKVYIDHKNRTYFVYYLERSKNQHHLAGQFNDTDSTLEDVEKWVRDNNYELVKKTFESVQDDALVPAGAQRRFDMIKQACKELGIEDVPTLAWVDAKVQEIQANEEGKLLSYGALKKIISALFSGQQN